VEEEKAVLARKLVRVEGVGRESSSMSVELETMQEELKEYKSQLKCSVCHDRRKEVRCRTPLATMQGRHTARRHGSGRAHCDQTRGGTLPTRQ